MTDEKPIELLPPTDGLGVNRLGNAILCYAWGETDRPQARIAKSAEDVRQFLIVEAFGNDKDGMLGEWMKELAAWDWQEDRQLRWEFEIGGVWLEDIAEENARATPKPTEAGATPRTDAAASDSYIEGTECVLADFARQLERELNEANEDKTTFATQIQELAEILMEQKGTVAHFKSLREKAQSLVAKSKGR